MCVCVCVGQYANVKPVVTPRFAVSCSSSLLNTLGQIARNNDLHIQVSPPTHPPTHPRLPHPQRTVGSFYKTNSLKWCFLF